MSFGLTKLLGALTFPSNFLVVTGLVGLVLGLFGFRAGRLLMGFCILSLALIMVTPLSTWLLLPLEQRFPMPNPLPEKIAGIIVLGGAIMPIGSDEHQSPQLNQDAERLTVVPGLMRHYPDAPVIFTGGSGDPRAPDAREAPYAAALLADLGVDMARVTLESDSRNTYENAILTKPLLTPGAGPWLLVTSASHMPRSMGVFRKAGIEVVPYPVGFVANQREKWRFSISLGENMGQIDRASHEYRGLLAYWLAGRTSALFPEP
ncbi:YdcF family protein [Niveispirillum irakense]|uniref:YdcF family protein n=1 Tax=Niveispirillum irakense TaxID=34011 RepID=UPI0004039F16|nr:YdcF family protein [Niveispirillum irakense]